jgi:predicted phosphoribosyltransferase
MLILSHFQQRCVKLMKFHNFADAANQLTDKLKQVLNLTNPYLLLGAGEHGSKLTQLVAANLDLNFAEIKILNSKDEHGYLGEATILLPKLNSKFLLVCDIGVETGTVASAIAAQLALSSQPATASFAAPVIPKEALAVLQSQYENVIAVRNPLIRRSMHWEYEQFS